MKISVNSKENTYPIIVEHGLLRRLEEHLALLIEGKKVAVITDDTMEKLWLDRLLISLPNNTPVYVIRHGESSKTWNSAGKILDWLADNNLTRSDVIIAFGGGVVGDMAGFVSSVYMRGINFIQIPTTLLAGIDSSIGGKTAVDLKAGKNLAGSFHSPIGVFFDLDILSTLPENEWKCGLGEAIKTAVLYGEELFSYMEEGIDKAGNLEKIIVTCINYKKKIVQEDERESNLRRCLNLGHTVGHAIEMEGNLKIAHGVCVAMGTKIIAEACLKKGWLSGDDYTRITALLEKYDLGQCPFHIQALLPWITHDKKMTGDYINIISIEGIGKCKIVKMSLDEMEEFLS